MELESLDVERAAAGWKKKKKKEEWILKNRAGYNTAGPESSKSNAGLIFL